LLLSFSSFSQEFKAGITTGFLVSQYDGDGYGGYNKPGLTFGGFVSRILSDKISLGFEIKFIQKGSADYTNYEKGDYESFKLRLNYIEMPFLFKYQLNQKIVAEAGFGGAYLISASKNINQQGFVKVTSYFDKFEIPFIIGASYKLSEKLEFSTRFSYSALPIRDHVGSKKLRLYWGEANRLISFSVNYKF
jgi:hypothetical protein